MASAGPLSLRPAVIRRGVRHRHDTSTPGTTVGAAGAALLSPAMLNHLTALVERHRQLTAELQNEEVLSTASPASIAERSKELARLAGAVALKAKWDSLVGALEEARAMVAECDMGTKEGREMAALGACVPYPQRLQSWGPVSAAAPASLYGKVAVLACCVPCVRATCSHG